MIMISGFSFTYLLGPSKDNRYFLCGALNASKATSRRNRQPTCSAPDHGLGMAGPIYSVGVVRSISFGKCHRPHRLASRTYSGLPLFPCVRKKTSSHKPRHFFINSKWVKIKKSKSFFHAFKATLDRLANRLLMYALGLGNFLNRLAKNDMCSILRPWISGRELRAFHRRRKVSIRSRSSCGVGSCRQAEYSIPSSQSREYCALCRESLRW